MPNTQTKQIPGRVLICGSVAFDTIMVFADRLRNHILPDPVHILNVSFLGPHKEAGGKLNSSGITRSYPFSRDYPHGEQLPLYLRVCLRGPPG
jgi:hypothetical protein